MVGKWGVETADRSHPSPNSGSRPPASAGARPMKAAAARANDQEVCTCFQNKSLGAYIKLTQRRFLHNETFRSLDISSSFNSHNVPVNRAHTQ